MSIPERRRGTRGDDGLKVHLIVPPDRINIIR